MTEVQPGRAKQGPVCLAVRVLFTACVCVLLGWAWVLTRGHVHCREVLARGRGFAVRSPPSTAAVSNEENGKTSPGAAATDAPLRCVHPAPAGASLVGFGHSSGFCFKSCFSCLLFQTVAKPCCYSVVSEAAGGGLRAECQRQARYLPATGDLLVPAARSVCEVNSGF